MQDFSDRVPAISKPPTEVWVHVALMSILLLGHMVMIPVTAITALQRIQFPSVPFGQLSHYEMGYLTGNILSYAFMGIYNALGLLWVPVNIYGITQGKKWARRSLLGYWILTVLTVCCFPIAVYPLYTLFQPKLKDWLSK